MKILAVDDDLFILELLTMIAGKAGYTEVWTASSGEAALDMLGKDDPVFDCLLLDICMPGMDGIELCSLARAIPAYSQTPIIMLTAMNEKDFIDRAFKAGATDYANKPFEIVELHARLRLAEQLGSPDKAASSDASHGAEHSPEGGQGHPFDLSDELAIGGVKDLIGNTALGNYLTQLSHAGIAGSQVVAIRIDDIEVLYARASSEEFVYALSEVADAISDALKTSRHMMSYAGDGTFVVVSDKAHLDPSHGLETEIQDLLDERDMEYDNGDPLDIEVSIGNPIRPRKSGLQRSQTTFDRAIARAQERCVTKKSQRKAPNIRLVGR